MIYFKYCPVLGLLYWVFLKSPNFAHSHIKPTVKVDDVYVRNYNKFKTQHKYGTKKNYIDA